MKKLILTASFTVFAIVLSFASPVKQLKSFYSVENHDFVENFQLASDVNHEAVNVDINLELDDDALDCKITITVSIGIVSVSGTVSGPCDEVKAQAVQLLTDLINEAKELASGL